jgi:hypothetical protein
MTPSMYDLVFQIAYDSMRVLRHKHPEYLPDIIIMSMPHISGSGWGQCALLPDGLPLLKSVSDTALKALLGHMSGSTALSEVQTGKSATFGPAATTPAKRKKGAGRGRGKKADGGAATASAGSTTRANSGEFSATADATNDEFNMVSSELSTSSF